MAVTIVQAGKCIAAFIALETRGWGRSFLSVRQRGVRKRRRVRVVENSRDDKRGRGNVLELMRPTDVIRLALLALLVCRVGLGRRLLVPR